MADPTDHSENSARCTICKEVKPLDEFYRRKAFEERRQSKCKDCSRTLERERRRRNPEPGRRICRKWYAENQEYVRNRKKQYALQYPERIASRAAFYRAFKRGEISKPVTCSRCGGGGQIDGHHPDYSKPLEVVWLCVSCHAEEHRTALRG